MAYVVLNIENKEMKYRGHPFELFGKCGFQLFT